MKLHCRGKPGLLIDTWDMFLLSSKILNAAVHFRVTLSQHERSRQKPKSITFGRTILFDAIVNTTPLQIRELFM